MKYLNFFLNSARYFEQLLEKKNSNRRIKKFENDKWKSQQSYS